MIKYYVGIGAFFGLVMFTSHNLAQAQSTHPESYKADVCFRSLYNEWANICNNRTIEVGYFDQQKRPQVLVIGPVNRVVIPQNVGSYPLACFQQPVFVNNISIQCESTYYK